MNVQHFYKAFAITDRQVDLKGFTYIPLNAYHLYVSPDYGLHVQENGNRRVIVLGYLMDTRRGDKSMNEIMQSLIISSDPLLDMEYFNGRYALIIDDEKSTTISTDAAGQRPVFYSIDHKVIASHELLVKALLVNHYGTKIEQNPEYVRGLLDETRVKGVFKLSGSHQIHLNTYSVERIFPRHSRPPMNLFDIVSELDAYISETNRWLKTVPNKHMSLTGGLDSRTTLAVVKPIVDDIRLFTYLKSDEDVLSSSQAKTYRVDKHIVDEITSNIPLTHAFFTIDKSDNEAEYYEALNSVVSSQHSFALSHHLHQHEQYRDALHIKSVVHSVGKAKFSNDQMHLRGMDALRTGFDYLAPRSLRERLSEADVTRRLIEYSKRTQMQADALYGYSIVDLMFLESRVGNFQSIITQETDNTLDVFNYFNTRKMISLFMTATYSERHTLALYKQLINVHWPVLNFFGVNQKANIKDEYERLMTRIDTHPKNLVKSIKALDNSRSTFDVHTLMNRIHVLRIIENEGSASFSISNPKDYPLKLKLFSNVNAYKQNHDITVSKNGKSRSIMYYKKGRKLTIQPNEEVDILVHAPISCHNRELIKTWLLSIEVFD